jgi:hypothetical protein
MEWYFLGYSKRVKKPTSYYSQMGLGYELYHYTIDAAIWNTPEFLDSTRSEPCFVPTPHTELTEPNLDDLEESTRCVAAIGVYLSEEDIENDIVILQYPVRDLTLMRAHDPLKWHLSGYDVADCAAISAFNCGAYEHQSWNSFLEQLDGQFKSIWIIFIDFRSHGIQGIF